MNNKLLLISLQYADDLAELNENARQGPHGEIIAGLQQESRQLRELQIENRELKVALQDYQNAVELIMSKYRSHTAQLIAANKVDFRQLCSEHQNKVNIIIFHVKTEFYFRT